MNNDSIRIRGFSKLEYGDPLGFLTALKPVELEISNSNLPNKIKRLRTNSLKTDRERRDAAIFCVGMEEVLGTPVKFAPVEEHDYDFVTTWQSESKHHFCPIQLKEYVPTELNPSQLIQDVVNGLSKYTDSMDLTVAIKLNRIGGFEPSSLQITINVQIGGIWAFGAITEDQSTWGLWGDFSEGLVEQGIQFQIPR